MLKYEEVIKATMQDNGIEAPQYLGYRYTIYCVNYIMEKMINGESRSLFMPMYTDCAKYYGNTISSRVERAIRFFRCRMLYLFTDSLKEKCCVEDTITNTTFLYALAGIATDRLKNCLHAVDKQYQQRVQKEKEFYFLLTNGNGFVNTYDIIKTAKIMNKTDIDENNEEQIIEFAKTLPGVKYVYSSEDLTPEDFLRYGQKVLAIRFCTHEFDCTIREARDMVDDLIKEKYNG